MLTNVQTIKAKQKNDSKISMSFFYQFYLSEFSSFQFLYVLINFAPVYVLTNGVLTGPY